MATKLINPAYELVGEVITTSSTSNISFSNLNITAADDYLLVADMITNSAGMNAYLTANGVATSGYYTQSLQRSGTTVSLFRSNNPYVGYATTSGLSYIRIKLTNSGYVVYQSGMTMNYGGSGILVTDGASTSTATVSSITSLNLAATSNPFVAGSRFRLYKCVAEKVADITVSTATTSVDIGNLNITKDSEYLLVSDVLNGSTSVSDYYLFANSNYTQSNYYEQYLYALNTSIGSGRVNDAVFCSNNGNSKLFVSTNIKLTNNGNFVYQNNESRDYGGSSITLLNRNNTSTFTTTSVNSLRISSTATNAIGVGSRFQLYKLR